MRWSEISVISEAEYVIWSKLFMRNCACDLMRNAARDKKPTYLLSEAKFSIWAKTNFMQSKVKSAMWSACRLSLFLNRRHYLMILFRIGKVSMVCVFSITLLGDEQRYIIFMGGFPINKPLVIHFFTTNSKYERFLLVTNPILQNMGMRTVSLWRPGMPVNSEIDYN